MNTTRMCLSEAVWYPFNAWCRAAAGRGPRGRPQTSSYLNYYGRPLTLPSRTLQADCIRLYCLFKAVRILFFVFVCIEQEVMSRYCQFL